MQRYRAILLLVVLVGSTFSAAFAQEINLLPKYGLLPKNEGQKEADQKFVADIDHSYKGNRKKAAELLDISYKALLYKIKQNGLIKRRIPI